MLGLAADSEYDCSVTAQNGESFEFLLPVRPIEYAPSFTVERDPNHAMDGVWTLFNDADGCFMGTRSHALIVDPDGEVPWESVIQVYDMAQMVGFQQVGFAVADEGGTP